MSRKDIIAAMIIEDFRQGKISRAEAASKLNLSEKSVQRRAKKIREQGLLGLLHGNKGRVPKNKNSLDKKAQCMATFREKYFDFNMAHAYERLVEYHGLDASYASFRRWCLEDNVGTRRKRRSNKKRLARERAANEGLMLQMDGSPHKWNGSDVWSLIALIDDATSDVPHAQFALSETTWACMLILKKVIQKKGLPEVIITDQAGWSTGSLKRQNFSQFVRACGELNIKVIGVSSPESKGRIERFNRTCQDRLIPEFRLNAIKSMTDANRYLEQCYLPEWALKRCVEPLSPTIRYRPLPLDLDLDEVFCLKFERTVNRDHTVHFENNRYKIMSHELGNLWKKQITVHQYQDEAVAFFYDNKKLETELMRKQTRRWERAS